MRACCASLSFCVFGSTVFPRNPAQVNHWRLTCQELGDVLACLQRACKLPLIYDVSSAALKYLSASGAVVLSDANVKSGFRQELVQAVVKDVPLCITAASPSVLADVIAASNSISTLLLGHIKSGLISCNPQAATLLFPVTFDKKPPPPTRWEQVLRRIVDSADDDKDTERPFLSGRCFRSCVSFTVVLVVASAPAAKAVEPKDAAFALECIG
jgi:hypothetical protein